MPTIGMTLTLSGKSNKGKNRINEHGGQWTIKKLQRNVSFDTRNGDWALVHNEGESYGMWILLGQDNDFRIEHVG